MHMISNVMLIGSEGKRLIHVACNRGDTDIVVALIENGADLNVHDA